MSPSSRLARAGIWIVATAATQASPMFSQATWWGAGGSDGTLRACEISGKAVAMYSAGAAFFFDTTLNVTRLANMNPNGLMNWKGAVAWADTLTAGGYADWQLPSVIDSGTAGCKLNLSGGTDFGYNVQAEAGGGLQRVGAPVLRNPGQPSVLRTRRRPAAVVRGTAAGLWPDKRRALPDHAANDVLVRDRLRIAGLWRRMDIQRGYQGSANVRMRV